MTALVQWHILGQSRGSYSPSGSAQLDARVLAACAQAEFEAGFERGGQTREHAQLAKTLGVAKLIVTVRMRPSLCPPLPGFLQHDGALPCCMRAALVKLSPWQVALLIAAEVRIDG